MRGMGEPLRADEGIRPATRRMGKDTARRSHSLPTAAPCPGGEGTHSLPSDVGYTWAQRQFRGQSCSPWHARLHT